LRKFRNLKIPKNLSDLFNISYFCFMKKLMFVFAISGFLFACGGEAAVSEEESENQDQVDSTDAADVFEQMESELEEDGAMEDGTEEMPNDAPTED
jgi:hypothetical protein